MNRSSPLACIRRYRPWPAAALHSVAMRYLDTLTDVMSGDAARSVATACTFVHQTMEDMCGR